MTSRDPHAHTCTSVADVVVGQPELCTGWRQGAQEVLQPGVSQTIAGGVQAAQHWKVWKGGTQRCCTLQAEDFSSTLPSTLLNVFQSDNLAVIP